MCKTPIIKPNLDESIGNYNTGSSEQGKKSLIAETNSSWWTPRKTIAIVLSVLLVLVIVVIAVIVSGSSQNADADEESAVVCSSDQTVKDGVCKCKDYTF